MSLISKNSQRWLKLSCSCFCLRPSAKDQGITWVLLVVFLHHLVHFILKINQVKKSSPSLPCIIIFFRMPVLSLAKEMACGSFPAIIRNNFAHFLCRMQNYFFCFHLKLFNIVKIHAVFIHLRSVRLSTTFRSLIVN